MQYSLGNKQKGWKCPFLQCWRKWEEIPGSVPMSWSAAMDRDQRFPKVLKWTESSRASLQVIRSYWAHLWCSPSADCTQTAGGLYEGVAVPLLSGCVSSGSQHNQLVLCFSENLSECVWVFFRTVCFSTCSVTSTSPSVFGSHSFVSLTCWWN